MYEAPSYRNVAKITLTGECIRDNEPPIIDRSPKAGKQSA
jgi:hypothetical protein